MHIQDTFISLFPPCSLLWMPQLGTSSLQLAGSCRYSMWKIPCGGAAAGAAGHVQALSPAASPAQTLGPAALGTTRIRKHQNSGLWLSVVLVPCLLGNAHGHVRGCLLCLPSHRVPSSVLLLPQLQLSCYTASKLAPGVALVLQA